LLQLGDAAGLIVLGYLQAVDLRVLLISAAEKVQSKSKVK
jgi:hypothetical protein